MNERLRSVMVQRGVASSQLAEVCQVDPKTVERWVSKSRVPHRGHRWMTANFLDTDEGYLWPEVLERDTKRRGENPDVELIKLYPNRAACPRETWAHLLMGAKHNIDVLVYSGTFFSQTPRIQQMLCERAKAGVKIRLCFGNADSDAVKQRDAEEGLRGNLPFKIRASLTYFENLRSIPGCEIRLHSTTLYTSIFRYDNDLMANPHAWGQPASANPLMHLRRLDGIPGAFDHYLASFDDVWMSAVGYDATRETSNGKS